MILSWSRGCESLQMHSWPISSVAFHHSLLHDGSQPINHQLRRSAPAPSNGSGKNPTPVFLQGESHGQRSLVGYSPGDNKESNKTAHKMHATPPLFSPIIYLFILIFFYFLLEYSCFTMLYKFLLHGKVNQLYVYKYPSFFLLFTSHLGHHRASSRVPWVVR